MKRSISSIITGNRKFALFFISLFVSGTVSFAAWRANGQDAPAAPPPIIFVGEDRGANRLFTVDAAAPGVFLSNMAITGLNPGEQLLGIDLRPANLQLYGLATNGATSRLLLINSQTGVATSVGSGFTSPQIPVSTFCGLGFAPATDMLHVSCFAGRQNFFINPTTGIVSIFNPFTFRQGDPHVGANPLVDEFAYAGDVAGVQVNTVYGIDDGTATFLSIGSPTDVPPFSSGQLTTVGQLNIGVLNQSGDMVVNRNDPSKVFATFNNKLFSVNVATGQGTLVGTFPAGSQIDGLALAPPQNVPPVPFIVTGPNSGSSNDTEIWAVPSIFAAVERARITPFPPSFAGGDTVAVGDINGDGFPDLIIGTATTDSRVKVFNGMDGTVFRDFQAFPGFTGGVSVAAGDTNGDGKAEVIVGAGPGGGPQVKIFDGNTGNLLNSFFAYSPTFTGGVFVAAGDFNGDGNADVVTGAGSGGAPEVKVFNGTNLVVLNDFNAFPANFAGGVFVAAGDVNGDGVPDIVNGAGPGGGPLVNVFDGRNSNVLQSFFAYNAGFTGGVRVSIGDFNNDSKGDVVTGPGPGPGPLSPDPSWLYPSTPDADAQVRVFSGATGSQIGSFLAYDQSFQGGIFVAAAGTPTPSLVTVSGRVLTPNLTGLRNATVSITDSQNVVRTATTSSFGFFSFANVLTGGQYVLRVQSRSYRYSTQTVTVNGDLTLSDFVGLE